MSTGDFDLFGVSESMHHDEAAARTRSRAEREGANRATIVHLEDRLERLSLVCMAMWSLLQDKTGVTEKDLLERVRTLDLMDGVADSKATRSVAKCEKCRRTMSNRHRRCLYCGHEKLAQSAFDAL